MNQGTAFEDISATGVEFSRLKQTTAAAKCPALRLISGEDHTTVGIALNGYLTFSMTIYNGGAWTSPTPPRRT